MQSFLGFVNFYRDFIPHAADISALLYDACKLDSFGWDRERACAFQELKDGLTSAPCLANPDLERAVVLQTDASSVRNYPFLSIE